LDISAFLKMLEAVIFDVDGVLVDSYDAHLQSWLRTAREHNVPFTEPDFARTFGRTSKAIIQEYWPRGGEMGDHDIRAIDDRKESLYREIVAASFPVMPGAVELIDALRGAGIRIAAGSSGPPENIELCLSRLGRREAFAAVVTGFDVTRGKPDPQVFLLAAARLGVPPHRAIVVEDAPAGVEAAHRAGMKCIGLVSTGRSRADLHAADLIVASVTTLTAEHVRELNA